MGGWWDGKGAAVRRGRLAEMLIPPSSLGSAAPVPARPRSGAQLRARRGAGCPRHAEPLTAASGRLRAAGNGAGEEDAEERQRRGEELRATLNRRWLEVFWRELFLTCLAPLKDCLIKVCQLNLKK